MSDKLFKAATKGDRAKQALDDPRFNEAVEALKAEYYSAWLSSPADDVDGRERLRIAAVTVDKIKAHLIAMMNDGKIARVQIEQLRKAA
jgi:hypothetical protein